MPHLVKPDRLPREALVQIVSRVQELLYLDRDADGRDIWNPAKDWSGWDVCQAMQESLNQFGLVPAKVQECVKPDSDADPTAANPMHREHRHDHLD